MKTNFLNRYPKLDRFVHSPDFIAVLAFSVTLFLSFNLLTPTMQEVNLWDESVYVNTGRSLTHGELPIFSRNPLIGVLYMLTYLPFQNSDFWLVQSVSLGRVVLYALLWWSAYLAFKRLNQWAPALVMAGFLFTSPILTSILVNPSDALFAAMSGFALWQLLGFYKDAHPQHLWLGSIFVGLAALARNDGLVLFGVYLALVVLLVWRKPAWGKRILAAAAPFVGIIGGYVLVYGLVTGSFTMGLGGRTYAAFLQGQAHLYQNDPDCKLSTIKCGVQAVQEIYGSEEENDNSVLRAIARNPQAYLYKLSESLRSLPSLFLKTYGKLSTILLLFFFVRGALRLGEEKEWLLLAVLLLWSGYLAVYFITFFRWGYLAMIYTQVYALAGIGLSTLADKTGERKETLIWSIALVVAAGVGIAAKVESLYLISLLALAIVWMGSLAKENKKTAVLFLSLAVGIMFYHSFNPPVNRTLGSIPEEEALQVIRQQIPEGSRVAAGAPGWVWGADMVYEDMQESRYNQLASPEDLYQLLEERGVAAVYVDHHLSNQSAALWALVEPGIGTYYETVYSANEGSIRILLVQPNTE